MRPRKCQLEICESLEETVPNNQNAIRTLVSAPWKTALNLALYMAHDELGVPGSGSMPEEDGELFIALLRDIFHHDTITSTSTIVAVAHHPSSRTAFAL